MSLPNDWKVAESVLPHVSRILLYGPPGTGKTTLGFSGDGPEPFYVGCHEEMSVAEFIGHFIPVGDRFVWMDGPGLAAWKKGRRIVIDEIDQASGAVMSVLRAYLNDPGVARLSLPDPALAGLTDEQVAAIIVAGEGLRTVKPAPGFQALATMNGLPEDLDAPLLDRFEAVMGIDSPHPDAIACLPTDLRKAARNTAGAKDERRVGIRRWKAFAALRDHVGEDVAARAVFNGRHGDVMDALRLARPDGRPDAGSVPDAPQDEPTAVESVPVAPVAPADVSDAAKPRPASYWIKKDGPGRRARAACRIHGKLTHTNAREADTGHLHCARCGGLIADPGKWAVRILDATGEWVPRP